MKHLISEYFTVGAYWSPDSQMLALVEAFGDFDGQVNLYNRDLERIRSIVGAEEIIRSFSWSPDSTKFVVEDRKREEGYPGLDFFRVVVWDTNGTELIHLFESDGDPPVDPKWSPTGQYVACGFMADVQHVRLYESDTGDVPYMLPLGQLRMISVNWSPDGSMIAAHDTNGKWDHQETLKVWRVDTGLLVLTIRFAGWHHAWSPDSSCIAIQNEQNGPKIEIWNVKSGVMERALPDRPGHTGMHHKSDSLAWLSPDLLLVCDRDGAIRIWDCASGEVRYEINDDTFAAFAISQSDGLIALCGYKGIYTWQPEDERLTLQFEQPKSDRYTRMRLHWSPDGTILHGTHRENHYFWYRDEDFRGI